MLVIGMSPFRQSPRSTAACAAYWRSPLSREQLRSPHRSLHACGWHSVVSCAHRARLSASVVCRQDVRSRSVMRTSHPSGSMSRKSVKPQGRSTSGSNTAELLPHPPLPRASSDTIDLCVLYPAAPPPACATGGPARTPAPRSRRAGHGWRSPARPAPAGRWPWRTGQATR